jgi:hypothetical protein
MRDIENRCGSYRDEEVDGHDDQAGTFQYREV